MDEGVVRLHFYPHLADIRYQAGVPGHYPPVVAPKHGVNVEGNLMSARLEQPPPVVPEEHNDGHIIVMEPNRRRRERGIMSPKVCKGLMWFQMVTASLICLVWCLTQLK